MSLITMPMINEAKDFVSSSLNISDTVRVGLVLGSGLSHYAEALKKGSNAKWISFGEIPHFPHSTVDGHKGEIIASHVNGWPILAMSGRTHSYEGYCAQSVALPIRVMGLLGVNQLILTNACGAIADHFEPGQVMVIKDHLNLTGASPLVGPNLSKLGPRFVDMSFAYDKELRSIAKLAADEAGLIMHEGVYASLLGPCYETPAEVRMLKTLGADAVGMSTVFETIVARHMGIKVLGISCLTNKAAGLSGQKITHEEVMQNNARVATKLGVVLDKIITDISG